MVFQNPLHWLQKIGRQWQRMHQLDLPLSELPGTLRPRSQSCQSLHRPRVASAIRGVDREASRIIDEATSNARRV